MRGEQAVRVAILADAVFDQLGGSASGRPDGRAATWLPAFADELLRQEGISVLWLSLSRHLPAPCENALGQHRFVELPGPPVSVDTWLSYRLARSRLLDVLRGESIDVLHCWGSESAYPSVLGAIAKPSLLSLNGVIASLVSRDVLPEGRWWKRQAAHERRWLPKADRVAVESRWAAEEVGKVAPGVATSIIPYGVHPSFYPLTWEPDPEDPYVLFAGTLSRGKGLDVLLDALALLPDRSWSCRIAGDGPLAGELEKRALPRVSALGSLDWPQYQEVLRKAWMLVLPTRADAHPNVIKEARVLGLPVLASAEGGHSGFLSDGGNSWILPDLTPRALAEQLDRRMADLSALKAAGAVNHAGDRQLFESRRCAVEFATLYREMAASSASASSPRTTST
jgi:glycosyltransferase involved in cell wall biosynthesis